MGLSIGASLKLKEALGVGSTAKAEDVKTIGRKAAAATATAERCHDLIDYSFSHLPATLVKRLALSQVGVKLISYFFAKRYRLRPVRSRRVLALENPIPVA